MAHPAWLAPTTYAKLRHRFVWLDAFDSPIRASLLGELKRGDAELSDRSQAELHLVIDSGLAPETFRVSGENPTVVAGGDPAGLLYGFFRWLTGNPDELSTGRVHAPAIPIRMVDHWDNVDIHPVMGQVERGYAGSSLFYDDGRLRWNLDRVDDYARLLASVGINAVCLNNVNVHATETTLLTTRLEWVERLARHFRAWGVRVHLSVNFASPIVLGKLDTCDPLAPTVQQWWDAVTDEVYARIPDFGGYVVKADSEGQPGPFAYQRTHADGANLLARAVARHGGRVHWRCFVYNHRQDWRDRSTDRARAAYDHFIGLDGDFDAEVILQIKHGPIDFQIREPVSPLLAAMPHTAVGLEVQLTQEYTGQQRHICYLPQRWAEQVLDFRPWGDERAQWEVVAGRGPGSRPGSIVAVANVGTDEFWTGHPFAQANLYGYGRLAWDPTSDPSAILDDWIRSTFAPLPTVHEALRSMILDSCDLYESYTAPLGVGFMVTPGNHYGPNIDGYEYSPWGTYHFADRDGIGVDRTSTSGSGYTTQYHQPWSTLYDSVDTCPTELLLFFHHVAWNHRLPDGTTVAQHIYDIHFGGVEAVKRLCETWQELRGQIEPTTYDRVSLLLSEQLANAGQWCDTLTSYVWRHSGIPDSDQRPLY
ncbi:MAG: hypothetical protein LBV06_00610 [Propionibacteriaceae bacterium]|jgi:alpha-glucuronidase|nr:hypothetical protein [Propionibacteriaceae bacterium]